MCIWISSKHIMTNSTEILTTDKIIIHWGNELWAIPGVNREAVCNNLWKTSSAIKQLVREKTITEWKKIYTTRELKWTVDDDNIEKDCINYKKPQLFSLPVPTLTVINRCSHLQLAPQHHELQRIGRLRIDARRGMDQWYMLQISTTTGMNNIVIVTEKKRKVKPRIWNQKGKSSFYLRFPYFLIHSRTI